MSGDSKFFTGVVVAAVLVIGGIALFSRHSSPANVSTDNLDYSIGHKLGPDTAAVKIVEFGDFQCPACAAARENLEKAQANNGTTVQIIFRHFPLPQHKNAINGALAAEAAGNQNKFWPMYDLLYTNQAEWENLDNPTDTFNNYAKQLNLDTAKFKKDQTDPATKKIVDTDSSYGQALSVDQTPTFYVNKVKYPGGRTLDEWQSLINAAASSKP